MIITDKFIMINFPKTGSTFARKVLEELYSSENNDTTFLSQLNLSVTDNKPYFMSIMLPEIEFPGKGITQFDQHGKWEQVPEHLKYKPVVSIVRNPYERYISAYEFNLWKTYLVDSLENIKVKLPSFPELSFEQYLDYQDLQIDYRFPENENEIVTGNQTAQFIQYFFKDPRKTFSSLCDDYIYSGDYKKDLPNVTFLRNENLNFDLWHYLLNQGYPKDRIAFILTKGKIRPENTYRSSDNERIKYYSENLFKHVNWKERYLIKIYADFGISYEFPL